jgi:hypothetical protein
MKNSRLRFLSDIANQSYSPSEVRRCIRLEDFWRYDLSEATLGTEIETYSTEFYSSNYSTAPFFISKLGDKTIFRVSNIKDALLIRRTDQILRTTLRTAPSNRDDEVRQLIEVLKSERHKSVFKGDIERFFESVDFSAVIDKLENDGLRNIGTLRHLRSINRQLITQANHTGLPRGLGISSTLADYILQDFDRSMLSVPSAVYFCRYVDDICLVHSADRKEIEHLISNQLPLKLKLNPNKSKHASPNQREIFNFLGYQIKLSSPPKVTVATSKISRTKKRIILSFRDYLKTNDFGLLYRRLLFLSTATEMTISGRETSAYSGFRYVYRHCTPHLLSRQMAELDSFLQAQLTSQRFWLSRAVRARQTPQQKNALRKISFYQAHKEARIIRLGRNLIAKIKAAWHYE